MHPIRFRLVRLLVWWVLPVLLTAQDSRVPAVAPDYFIVVTGGELLEGVYPDAHTVFLTRTLRPLGLRCVGSLCVDDQRTDIQNALRFAGRHAGLVLVTGGLGPTPNDITREMLSEFTGIPLRESPQALSDLERRFNQTQDQLRPNLRRQCLVPERGGFLRNANGTAVGLIFELGRTNVLVALPGPPRELQRMVRDELLPWLQSRFGVRAPGAALTLRFVGVGQSQIDQTIKDRVTVPADVIITSLFEGSRVDFTLHLPGNGAGEVARLAELGAAVRTQLGAYCYADDGSSLEQVVLRALGARRLRLALAEVGSGGGLAASLNAVPEAAGVVAGAFAAPTEDRLARLVQPASGESLETTNAESRVKALAAAAASHAQADWAVAVGAVEGPVGGRQVWLALKAGDRWDTQRLALRDAGEVGRASLVTQALDRLRHLLASP